MGRKIAHGWAVPSGDPCPLCGRPRRRSSDTNELQDLEIFVLKEVASRPPSEVGIPAPRGGSAERRPLQRRLRYSRASCVHLADGQPRSATKQGSPRRSARLLRRDRSRTPAPAAPREHGRGKRSNRNHDAKAGALACRAATRSGGELAAYYLPVLTVCSAPREKRRRPHRRGAAPIRVPELHWPRFRAIVALGWGRLG